MDYHRNPSPPDSPTPVTGQSHDITITSSTNAAQSCNPDSAAHEKSANNSVSLVDYDNRIGDTVFSKAWVLSLLVKAVEAVREQQSKTETSNRSEDNINERDVERSELNIEDRQNMLSNRTTQPDSEVATCNRGDAEVMGMESLECDQPDIRDRPLQDTSSEPDRSDSLAEASNRDEQPCATTEEVQTRSNIDDSSEQRTEKESMIFETSPADSDQEEREREGEVGGDSESDWDEGGDGLVDRRDRSLLGGVEEISESLENDLCRLWDASMNMVCH